MISEVSYPYLEKLISIAKENYPKVKALDKGVEGAKADVSSASLSWFEPFNFNYVYRPNPASVDIGDLNNIFNGPQYGISVNLGRFIQTPFVIKKSKTQLSIAQQSKDEYMLSLEAEVKARYFLYIQKLTELRIISKIVLDQESVSGQMKNKFEKGEENLLAYNQVLTQLGMQYSQKITTEGQLLTAKSSLEELLGKKLEEIK